MYKGKVIVIYGMGKGKTTSAIGKSIKYLAEGRTVSMIQFLKGSRESAMFDVLRRFEPDMKVFRFEKHLEKFSELDEEEKTEELANIRNGLNFAQKVLTTESCDVLILDEVLGLIDRGIIPEEDLISIIRKRPDSMDLMVTGRVLCDGVRNLANEVYRIDAE